LNLYFSKERCIKETAATLGITDVTAKSRIQRDWNLLCRLPKQWCDPAGLATSRDELAGFGEVQNSLTRVGRWLLEQTR